jgi:hypothetical protein
MRQNSRLVWVCGLLAGLGFMAGCSNSGAGTEKKGGTTVGKTPQEEVLTGLQATEITKEFAKAEQEAEKKYSGKVLEVEGVVQRGNKSHSGDEYVVFIAGSQEANDSAPRTVSCYFALNSPELAKAEALKKDQKVKIRGKYSVATPYGVSLKNCVVVE